jgi:hypothetical protein
MELTALLERMKMRPLFPAGPSGLVRDAHLVVGPAHRLQQEERAAGARRGAGGGTRWTASSPRSRSTTPSAW